MNSPPDRDAVRPVRTEEADARTEARAPTREPAQLGSRAQFATRHRSIEEGPPPLQAETTPRAFDRQDRLPREPAQPAPGGANPGHIIRVRRNPRGLLAELRRNPPGRAPTRWASCTPQPACRHRATPPRPVLFVVTPLRHLARFGQRHVAVPAPVQALAGAIPRTWAPSTRPIDRPWPARRTGGDRTKTPSYSGRQAQTPPGIAQTLPDERCVGQ